MDALNAFRERAESYDLVLTDMTMPGITGDKLAAEMMRIRPDIPVVLCTGFSEQITEETALALGISAFIMKPIVVRDMAERIRKVLDVKKDHRSATSDHGK
jgi:CheY-like chemotaxis protein